MALCSVIGAGVIVSPIASATSAVPVAVVQTSHTRSQRLAELPSLGFTAVKQRNLPIIDVNDSLRYQRFIGVGGAMTDTSAWLIHDRLPTDTRKALMSALFGTGGIHLGVVRVPMGASDFTATEQPYSYDDLPAGKSDPTLSHFSIVHDEAYILPVLRDVLALNPHAEIIATPWSPPSWMKTNDAPDNPGDTATLRHSAYKPFADYFVKFLEAYARQGVGVTAITPQNEPGQGTSYPGMSLPEPSEARFIAEGLKPALHAAGLRTEIYGFDYDWSAELPAYVHTLLGGPARSSLAGIAYHCYGGNPNVMDQLHQIAPQLQQLVTECSPGLDHRWFAAELEIASLRDWASSVGLWNLALDRAGGPVQPPNSGCSGCSGLVTVDTWTHQVTFGLSYYQLGQVSKFVAPGAERIYSNHFVSYLARAGATPGLDDVAFLNPDGRKVLVTYNNSEVPIKFAVQWRGLFFSYTLPAEAMATFEW